MLLYRYRDPVCRAAVLLYIVKGTEVPGMREFECCCICIKILYVEGCVCGYVPRCPV